MSDASSPVLSAIERGVMTVTLNRPTRLNASNRAMSEAFVSILSKAAGDADVRVIVITGAGKGFCAGADRDVLAEHAESPGEARSGSRGLPYSGLRTLGKPVIAAINGACAGIGLALACCCDVRFAAEEAFFLAPFARLGLPAETGLAWLLPRLIGTGYALDMLLSARRVTAQEALAMRLVERVLPGDRLLGDVQVYASHVAESCAPSSLMHMKAQIDAAWSGDFAAAEADAARLTRVCLEGADFREAMAAGGDGRSPKFEGRALAFTPNLAHRRSS